MLLPKIHQNLYYQTFYSILSHAHSCKTLYLLPPPGSYVFRYTVSLFAFVFSLTAKVMNGSFRMFFLVSWA